MANKPKGGRGKTVPYKSIPIRVPEPLLEQCREMIDFYQEFLEQGGDPAKPFRYIVDKPPSKKKYSNAEYLLEMIEELETYTPLVNYPGNSSSEK